MARDLSHHKRDYDAVRQDLGMCEWDLFTDVPVDAATAKTAGQPLLKTQSSAVRAIRGSSATATIDQSRGEYIARLHRHVVKVMAGEAGQVVHVVRPSRDPYAEDGTLNYLTFCEQTEVARSLNALESLAARLEKRPPIVFTDNKSLITLSRPSSSEEGLIGRLVQQPLFAASELSPGDKAVIVDDHIDAGASMLAMESSARSAGADVLAFAALSVHPFSTQLTMSVEVQNFLDRTLAAWDPAHLVTDCLARLGMPRDKLTNNEALVLIAYAIDAADEAAVATFEALQKQFFDRARLHNTGINPDAADAAAQMNQWRQRQDAAGTDSARAFIERARAQMVERDSLTPTLQQCQKSPQELVRELDEVSRCGRPSVKASNVKQVIVLDWDDCLRDEKGLTYQIMHNALVVAAKENAKTFPELGDAVSRLQSGNLMADPAPLLIKNQEDFTTHMMANPRIFHSHVAEDFVRTMLPGSNAQRIWSMAHAISAEFTRQYRAMTNPEISKKPEGLPYPDVQLSLLPGARELLEKCRTAESRVILISNRGHHDVEREVNHLGMMHYFDVVSGAPLVTQSKPGGQPAQMPEGLQQRLIHSLSSGDDMALRQVLDEVADHAHPDTTLVDGIDRKPAAARLVQSLESLSVQPDVPIVSYGDQNSDVAQLAELAGQGRRLEGVIINPVHNDVGQQVDIAGIPTRVMRSMTYL